MLPFLRRLQHGCSLLDIGSRRARMCPRAVRARGARGGRGFLEASSAMPAGGRAGDGALAGHDRCLRGPRHARGCAPRHACMDVRRQHGAPASWWDARRVGGVGMRASVASAGSATPV
jgi:hypothetical protein